MFGRHHLNCVPKKTRRHIPWKPTCQGVVPGDGRNSRQDGNLSRYTPENEQMFPKKEPFRKERIGFLNPPFFRGHVCFRGVSTFLHHIAGATKLHLLSYWGRGFLQYVHRLPRKRSLGGNSLQTFRHP